jgi:hypothetical protein
LAATQGLHDTIKGLRDRIRALETALNDMHLGRTSRTHPLLSGAKFDQDAEEKDVIRHEGDIDHLFNPMDKPVLVRGRDGAQRISATHGRAWVTHVSFL